MRINTGKKELYKRVDFTPIKSFEDFLKEREAKKLESKKVEKTVKA